MCSWLLPTDSTSAQNTSPDTVFCSLRLGRGLLTIFGLDFSTTSGVELFTATRSQRQWDMWPFSGFLLCCIRPVFGYCSVASKSFRVVSLASQCPINAETGQVLLGQFHLSGNPSLQKLLHHG